jgi:hypothetical protein
VVMCVCAVPSGNTYIDNVAEVVTTGLVNQSVVQESLARTFKMRFQLGLFDPKVGMRCLFRTRRAGGFPVYMHATLQMSLCVWL